MNMLNITVTISIAKSTLALMECLNVILQENLEDERKWSNYQKFAC